MQRRRTELHDHINTVATVRSKLKLLSSMLGSINLHMLIEREKVILSEHIPFAPISRASAKLELRERKGEFSKEWTTNYINTHAAADCLTHN